MSQSSLPASCRDCHLPLYATGLGDYLCGHANAPWDIPIGVDTDSGDPPPSWCPIRLENK